MKLLVIGMDGASLKTFQRGWTPYISSLIESGTELHIYEDLITRGWSEIYTGQDASVTGALYDRANLDGTHGWSLNFDMKNIPGIGETIKPIWQVLNEKGFKVGIMNLPTVSSAQKVDGFFVTGGGGGKAVKQKPDLENCYPEKIHEKLLDMDYIVDERMGSLLIEKKIKSSQVLFDRMAYKNNRRTKAFVDLAEEFNIDFGFIVYKSSSNLAEFISMPEIERMERGEKNLDTDLLDAAKSYYQAFDLEVKKIRDAFPDTEIIFTADHGMSTRKYLVNLNKFLQEHKFQKPKVSKSFMFNSVYFLKKLVPFSVRVALRKNKKIKSMYESATPFDNKNSLAFSMPTGDWVHGIYINDKERFGGPVNKSEKLDISKKIIHSLNTNELAKKHNIIAKLQPESTTSPYYPDVVIEVEDGYMTSNEGKSFIEKFNMPKGKIGLNAFLKGKLLTGKGHYPISVSIGHKWKIEDKESYKLTDIYTHIINRFNED